MEEDKEELLILLHDKDGKYLFYNKMREGLLPLMESFVDCGIIKKEGMERQFLSLFLSDALTSYLILFLENNSGMNATLASSRFLQLF